MAQAQSYSGVLNLAFMLPLNEQALLVKELQNNLFQQIDMQTHYTTPKELKTRLRKSHEQALAGDVLTLDEAHQMMENFVKTHIQEAV